MTKRVGQTVAVSTSFSIDVATGSMAGGTTITLTGTRFVVNGISRVTFGGSNATSLNVVNATSATCVTPEHLVEEAVDVVLYPVYGPPITLAAAFTYAYVAPTLVSLTPNNGDNLGGDSVVVAGTNFLSNGDEGSYVLFFGSDSASWGDMTWISSTSFSVMTPRASGPGVVDVYLSDNHGSSNTLTGGFTFNP